MSTVWGLVDDRTGHTGQVLGVIAKLGLPYVLKNLNYNMLAKLPTTFLGASLSALDAESTIKIAAPYPPLVIAAGRRLVPVLRYIKKQSPSTITVYLMWPETTKDIDLIAVPEHDRKKADAKVITTLAPLHAVTPEALAAAAKAWEPQFKHLPRPYVALCLGGDTKKGSYHANDWREILQRAVKLVGDGSLLITTSRRTPPEAIELCGPLLQTPHLLHRWDRDKDNPYLGILACADGIVVTGDSLSMCTEACVTGKPVYIYAASNVTPAKHARLHTALYERGMAKPLDYTATLDWKPVTALDDVGDVAAEIRKRFRI